MAEQTPIPAEALAAAIEEAWRIAVCYGELVPDEAKRHLSVSGLTPHMALNRAQVGTVVTRIAPILLAAGRTAPDVLAENERLRVDLAHWASGRRTRGIPPPTTVPDGLTYAAKLVRAQGTEGGEDHDRLLREASMRLKALHDLASRQQDELVWLREDRDAAHAAGRTAAAEDIRAHADDQERAAKERPSLGEVRRQVGAVVNAYRVAARVAENGADR